MIIHINGWPGVGKLTVARIIAERLDARLIDNHLIVNPSAAIYEHGSPDYMRANRRIREVLFDELARAPREEVHVLTDALEDDSDFCTEVFEALAELARRRGVPLLSVSLDCDSDENARRLVSPDRAHRGKLRNVETLLEIRRVHTLMRPAFEHRLDLDTTGRSPDSVAAEIIAAAPR